MVGGSVHCAIIVTEFLQAVSVPLTNNPLSEEDYQQLQLLVDPLAENNNYGIVLSVPAICNEHTKVNSTIFMCIIL